MTTCTNFLPQSQSKNFMLKLLSLLESSQQKVLNGWAVPQLFTSVPRGTDRMWTAEEHSARCSSSFIEEHSTRNSWEQLRNSPAVQYCLFHSRSQLFLVECSSMNGCEHLVERPPAVPSCSSWNVPQWTNLNKKWTFNFHSSERSAPFSRNGCWTAEPVQAFCWEYVNNFWGWKWKIRF